MTNDDVGRLACDILVEGTFTALTDDVAAARLITRNFVPTRRAELRKHVWNFALSLATVSGVDTDTGIGTLNWRYAIPASLLSTTNLVQVPAFASDTVWSKGTGWTIAAGVASKAAGVASQLTQAITLEEKRQYRLGYTISSYSAGLLTPGLGDATKNNAGLARDSTVVSVEDILCPNGADRLLFSANAAFAGSIDDVSLYALAKTLRVLPLTFDGEPSGVGLSYRVEGDYLITDQSGPVKIRTISDIEDPDDWDALFVDVMAAALAVKIAHPLTGKIDMIKVAQGAYDRAVSAAVRVNAIERQGRLYTNSWAIARGDTRGWWRP